MWLKNLSIYGIRNVAVLEGLEEKISQAKFLPPGTHEVKTQGFVPVFGDQLVFQTHGQLLLRFATEKKVVPKSAVDSLVEARCEELEEQQGFPPGKLTRKEIVERARDELVAKALTTRKDIHIWVDTLKRRLVIGTASNPVCDDVIKLLLKCIEKLDLEHLPAWPGKVLGEWIDEAPYGFSVDDKVNLRYPNNRGTTVAYNKADLGAHRALEHIRAGAEVASLAMTFNDRVSFTISPVQRLTGVKPLDIIKESQAVPDVDRFENDVILMSREYGELIDQVVQSA